MKCAIVVFPGSNCDHDCYHVLKNVFDLDAEFVWHKEDGPLDRFDLVILPGGFSYGDYLRAGSIAKFSPVMKSIIQYAGKGGRVLGICNGFQILVESGLLPGAMLHNRSQKFICKNVHVRIETTNTPFTSKCVTEQVLQIPIAHHQGSYFADADTLKKLADKDQIVLRYCDANGEISDESNPNGSLENIAGISNEEKNVLGMMPHPERCADPLWSRVDGQEIFKSVIQSC